MDIRMVTYNKALPNDIIEGSISVVIDVFRATSSIVSALYNGAKEIYINENIEDVFDIASRYIQQDRLIVGERNMIKVPGFDLGNSPSLLKKDICNDKTIIMTTTNGSKALKYSEMSSETYIGCFLNSRFISEILAKKNKDVVLICSGSLGRFSLEDALCAGKIFSLLSENMTASGNDMAICMSSLYEIYAHDIHDILRKCRAYRLLKTMGLIDDLRMCLTEDIYNIAPQHNNGRIVC